MRDAQQAELAELEKLCANLPEEIAAAKRSIDRLTRESDQLLASAISNELEIEKAERGCVRASARPHTAGCPSGECCFGTLRGRRDSTR
jgi:hypothetical protein